MIPAHVDTKRIAILTGGGDVPGLNAVIKSVVYRATEAGYEVLGLRRGWEGLTHVQPELPDGGGTGYLRPLDRINTRTIDRTGGTILHTSRTNPRKMRTAALPAWLPAADAGRYEVADGVHDLTPLVLDHLAALGIDVLVTIGGDDTLSYSQVLADAGVRADGHPQDDGQRRPGHGVLHRLLDRHHPGQGGDQPPADDARLARADRRVPDLRSRCRASPPCTPPTSRRRVASSRRLPYDLDALAGILAADHAANPSHYAVRHHRRRRDLAGRPDRPTSATADAFGHRHKANVGEALAEELRARTGIETLASELTYDLRSGEPDSIDSMVATTFANVAMDLIVDGVTGRMVAIQDGKYAHTALPDPALGPRKVDVEVMYNAARFRPALRGQAGRPDAAGRPRLRPRLAHGRRGEGGGEDRSERTDGA